MKKILCLLAILVGLNSFGQDTNAINADFQLLAQKIHAKIAAGKTNSTDLKRELAEFDRLIAAEKGTKTEEAAHMVYMKAMLFIEILGQAEEGKQILQKIKTDYPSTLTARQAEETAMAINRDEAAKKIRDSLVIGAPVPNFAVKDVQGNPLSLADFKGKVLLIDFWATYCPTLSADLPHLVATYKKHHADGFEIIGVSLDTDHTSFDTFFKQHPDVNWFTYCDGRGWDSELVTNFGLDEIPSSLLIGPDGKLLGKSLKGDALERALAAALTKK